MIELLFAAVGAAMLGYAGLQLRPAYHVYRGETQDIIEVERKEGPVEIEGTAETAAGTLEAPISGQECLAYEYEVEEYQSSGKNSSWNTVDEGEAATPFRLEDQTASALVDATGAAISLETDDKTRVDGGEEEPPAIREFLDKNADLDSQAGGIDVGPLTLGTGNDRRYREARLHPGDEAYVLGQTDYDVDARESMRDISAVVRDGEEAPAFVVAQGDQNRAARRLFFDQIWTIVLGLALLIFGLVTGAPELLRLIGM